MSRLHLLSLLLVVSNSSFAQDTHVHDHAAATEPVIAAEPMEHQHEMPVTPETNNEPMAMDHMDMPMATDVIPENARDPDAYSAGFTQTEGPYNLENPALMMHAEQHKVRSILADRVEYDPDSDTGNYELQAWRGTSFDRLVIKSEGAFSSNNEYENETELLWGHAITAFWDTQLGVRVDSHNDGKNRQWLAAGVQGLAPYWFELDSTFYLGSAGQTELVFDSEYDFLLTQRLILQPRADFTLRGKDDPSNHLGSGLANASVSLRLRYEFSRQFAPFVGVASEKHFGNTAQFMRQFGEASEDTRYFAGIRFWF